MYSGYLTDIEGIKVGHAQDFDAITGCTAIICEQGVVGGVDVRGSGPGTRETDLFDPKKMVDRIHGIVLGGGSAFGLSAASGTMKYLEEKGIGFDVGVARVPIVASAILFDLAIGNPKIRPDEKMGYEAAKNASTSENRQGNIGAGTGATIGKLQGPQYAMKSGLGSATVEARGVKVSAMVAVNAVGDVYSFEDNHMLAGMYDYENEKLLNTVEAMKNQPLPEEKPTNTTIGVIATDAVLTKAQANKLAEMAHNGYARTINPIHTYMDGDTIFAIGTNKIEADISLVGTLAAEAMGKAVINAVKSAETIGKIKAFKDI